jgi:ubiquinone/menaquinone biosynthesis C-methylase UbiE
MNGNRVSQEQVVESGLAYFDLQAYIGTTKHMGGLAATRELAALCRVDHDTIVLDLGSGVGATPCYLARTNGAHVVGVDIRRAMVAQARERARKENVEDIVEFQIADALALPFEDSLFSATIGESVVSFFDDKQCFLQEAARVTAPGGCVGFNEEVWLKTPPQRLVEFARLAWNVEPLSSTAWAAMMEDAGLHDVVVERRTVNTWREATQIKRYHLSDLLRMGWRTLSLYLRQPAFRTYMAERKDVPRDLFDYLGYALIGGRK